MSLVDNVFGGIPGPLIDQWGINATYVKVSQYQSYDPESGTVFGSNVEIAVKILIGNIESKESEGLDQKSKVKIILSAKYLNGYYPRITDSIRYLENGVERTAKICDIMNQRGDLPIMHTLIGDLG